MFNLLRNLAPVLSILLVVLVPELSFAQGALDEPIQFDTQEIDSATCQLMDLMQGTVGAMLTAVAGIGAIVGAAFGAYRAAFSLLTVSTASFILPALVSLWFGFSDANCVAVDGPINNNSGGQSTSQPAGNDEVPILEDCPPEC